MLCFILLVSLVRKTSETPARQFIVWDVGQGAWSTFVEAKNCWHIDMGGTKFNFISDLRTLCQRKLNVVYLTHFDSDHINLLNRARSALPQICLVNATLPKLSARKRRWLSSLPVCPSFRTSPVLMVYRADYISQNDSNMYVVDNSILVTGDASKKLEQKILTQSHLEKIEFFVLGHHGSRTSSSEKLLDKLPNLHAGLASCEKRKYGHPHKEVERRLRARHVPLLTTELFGRITMERTRP